MLEKKVALVTGAGSGIGREIACHYAAAGAAVVVSDLNEKGGEETVSKIASDGGQATFLKADSSKPAQSEALVTAAVKQYGGLHIACNNAGVGGPSAPVGEYPLDAWDKVISINLSGVFYGMRYQLPAMLASGGGAIVNIASILGQVGFRNSSAYVAAKHGVVGLTRNAALEYGTQKIRVNAVGPAFIKTPLLDEMGDEEIKALVALHPVGRLGEPAEVANLVLWLSSDKASFVTGSYYAVDGGYLAQ
ncbi:glucose 1-dehydrogenase [Nitrospiraceae bacterium HYJII51-Mn-bac16s-1-B09]|uniref:Glucose 1-dehydrogenase n=1 Tax=Candidatus Manganitrophus noduliformans TaxID=2606439 RepID=A0A7X6DSN3_9BACT|nr:glucose 1-dehydrogenase [Candidatus Manganitrophus noduliformans]